MNPKSSACGPRRRGYTLLEMLVVMAIGGLLAGTMTSLLFTMLKARDTRIAEHEKLASFVRLDHQWRADVRAASAVVVPPTPQGSWNLKLSGDTVIEYASGPQVLKRTVHVGTAVAGREEFQLPEGAQVQCHWPEGGQGLAWLLIEYPAAVGDPASLRTRRIEAPLAADWRLTAHP